MTPPPTSTSKGVGQTRGQRLPHGRTSSSGVGSTWNIESAIHAFADALHNVVTGGVGAALIYLSPVAPPGRVSEVLLLPLCFSYGVAVYLGRPPIWENLVHVKGSIEGLNTLN